MAEMQKLCRALRQRGYRADCFATAQAAEEELERRLDGVTVAFGGSMTLEQMGLYERLSARNKTVWHWRGAAPADAEGAEVYICSVNGAAETGELVNIDGNGNRLAGSLYGHKRVILIIGKNKLAPTLDAAIRRARNVAAPLNARRLGRKTPCAMGEEVRCFDCDSPERICKAMTVLWRAPGGAAYEVLLVDEALGY